MVVNAIAPLTAGEPLQDAKIEKLPVAAATTFTKGDVVFLDTATDTWTRAPVGAVGDFGVAMDDATATTAAKKIRIQTGGRVTVVFDGACAPTNPVMISGTTAGRVVEYVATATTATYSAAEGAAVRDEFKKIVGYYSGKESGSDRDGLTIPAIAGAGEIGIITLNGRRGGGY